LPSIQSHSRVFHLSLLRALLTLSVSSVCVPAQTLTAKPHENNFVPTVDFSLGVSGELTDTRTPMERSSEASAFVSQKTQAIDASAGVLGTFHQSIKPWLGYNVNVGYTRSTHDYSYAQGFIPNPNAIGEVAYSQGAIKADRFELTLGYVFEGPGNKRLRTFAQVGGGGLFFVPTASYFANQQTRPTMLFGVGMEYQVTPHLGVRAEYRGLFYKGPDFAYDFGNIPVQRLFTITSSPTISIVYRFGHGKKSPCVCAAH
jgi:opacity protein-like surface antigen